MNLPIEIIEILIGVTAGLITVIIILIILMFGKTWARYQGMIKP